jgi:hypothetical protein
MEHMSRKARFNNDLALEQAAQISFALMSEETYGLLVTRLGWSVPEWSHWMLRHARADLTTGS